MSTFTEEHSGSSCGHLYYDEAYSRTDLPIADHYHKKLSSCRQSPNAQDAYMRCLAEWEQTLQSHTVALATFYGDWAEVLEDYETTLDALEDHLASRAALHDHRAYQRDLVAGAACDRAEYDVCSNTESDAADLDEFCGYDCDDYDGDVEDMSLDAMAITDRVWWKEFPSSKSTGAPHDSVDIPAGRGADCVSDSDDSWSSDCSLMLDDDSSFECGSEFDVLESSC